MTAVRLCARCGRHNGPSFRHCITCGSELPQPPSDAPDVAADRAQRFLDQLTPERRRLLPEEFIRSVEQQAGVGDPQVVTASGRMRTIDSQEFSISQIAGASARLGPRRRDRVADVVTQPDFPAIFDPAFNLGAVDGHTEPPSRPVSPPRTTAKAKPVSPPRTTAKAKPVSPPRTTAKAKTEPPAPRSRSTVRPSMPEIPSLETGDAVPVVDSDLHDVHSFDDLRSVGKALAAAPSWTGRQRIARPRPQTPLLEALSSGTGPFGPREARFRLIMLPDPGYRSRIHFLQHRLSQTLEVDLFKARQFLQREMPTFLSSADSSGEVEGMAEHLRAGGVRVLLLERKRWNADSDPTVVAGATGEAPGPVTFLRPDGTELRVYRADLAWAAVAEIEQDPDPLSTAGASVNWNAGASITADVRRGQATWLMDVVRHGSRSPIRVRSESFDFDCLGAGKTMAAHLNLRKLLAWLSPDADAPLRVDDSFKRVTHATGIAARGDLGEDAEAIASREVEFTEYVLLLDAGQRDVP